MKLAEAMNTYNISLLTIKNRGYNISLEIDKETDMIISWIARKGKNEVFAFNPLSLLALVYIIDEYGDKWNQISTGDLYNEILDY